MWWFVFQNAILSICIIIILQYLWEYCKTNYTTRKTKHIVDTQTQKYRDIINEIHQGPGHQRPVISNTPGDQTPSTTITYEGKPSDAQRVIPRTPQRSLWLRSGVLTNNALMNVSQTDTLEIESNTDYISEKDKAQMIKELTQFLHTETGSL